jgi:hypothetical protein
MANLNSFTHPGTFRRIRPQDLISWLAPWRDYLARRGFTLPADPGEPIDYDALAAVFMEPDTEMPRELMHSACMIHEMSNDGAMQSLLDGAKTERIELQVGDDPDPADVAVQLWLHDPDVLEELHNLHQLDRPRGFVHFTTDRDPVPEFREPTDEQLTTLENDLADWHFERKRGRNARVWMYKRPEELWFLVRHGLASRRQEVISGSGSETLIVRLGEYDVVVYNVERGDIRIHGNGQKEVEMLRMKFGQHLFGDPEFFPGGAKFTLAPLIRDRRNSLACGDVPEIANITLTSVQFLKRGSNWRRTMYDAPDIFDDVERGDLVFPVTEDLIRAKFLVRFKDSKKQRTVTIAGSNQINVVRDGDTVSIERLLAARGFVLENLPDEVEAGSVVSV